MTIGPKIIKTNTGLRWVILIDSFSTSSDDHWRDKTIPNGMFLLQARLSRHLEYFK